MNECVGPRQGNNAAQLSKTVPMTGSTEEWHMLPEIASQSSQ
jgi:hypothetical protein